MITNARYTRDSDPEYEVAWNGVNDGQDGDLLCPERRQPEKSTGVPLRPGALPAGVARDTVWAALPAGQPEAITFRELVTRTGLLPASVNSALHVLRLAGRLESESLPGATGYKSRPPQRYWRRA
jgi:hypothetical protein